MIVLSACNTDEKDNDSSTNLADNAPVATSGADATGNPSSSTQGDSDKEQTTSSTTLSYEIAGKAYSDEIIATKSEELNYTVSLTDKFYLTLEEPGKDLVVYKDNEAITMRVETFINEDEAFENLLLNSKDMLSAISTNDQYNNFPLPKQFNLNKYAKIESYIVEYESDKVILLLLEKDDLIIRLTLFDDYITNVTDAFLQIGATIE